MPVGAEQLGHGWKSRWTVTNSSATKTERIREEIIPYWKGEGDWKRHWFYQNYAMLPPETRNLLYGDPSPDLAKIGIITRSRATCASRVDLTEVPGQTDGLGRGIISDGLTRHHVGHCSFGYEKVLRKGFMGIKKDAEDRIARLDFTKTEDLHKVPFLKGVIIAMEAAAGIGPRFAASARKASCKEKDQAEKVRAGKNCCDLRTGACLSGKKFS